jgi:hypothetical protein
MKSRVPGQHQQQRDFEKKSPKHHRSKRGCLKSRFFGSEMPLLNFKNLDKSMFLIFGF